MTNATYQSVGMTAADFKVAIAFERVMHILYTGTDGVTQWREVEPHEVRETKDGNLIVVAMCRLRGELRSFRLDRVFHYVPGTRGFTLELPAKVDPDEVTDWWTLTSRSGHEVIQVELNTDGESRPHALVMAKAQQMSGKVRAVVKAEGGISIRRLRRRDVKALNQAA